MLKSGLLIFHPPHLNKGAPVSDDTLFFFILVPSLVSIIFFPTGVDRLLNEVGKSKARSFALILFFAHIIVGLVILWFAPTMRSFSEGWKTWGVICYYMFMCIQYLRLASWIRKNG